MIKITLEVLWLFLPAGVANTMPVVAARFQWLPGLNVPLDGGIRWRGSRLLGQNKTLRGIIIGILYGSIVGIIQHWLYQLPVFQALSLVSYQSLFFAALWGGWLGFGALLGDAVKSFFKRRRTMPAGSSWIPFDQIDAISGALIVGACYVQLSGLHVVMAILVFGMLMYVVSVVGVLTHVKEKI